MNAAVATVAVLAVVAGAVALVFPYVWEYQTRLRSLAEGLTEERADLFAAVAQTQAKATEQQAQMTAALNRLEANNQSAEAVGDRIEVEASTFAKQVETVLQFRTELNDWRAENEGASAEAKDRIDRLLQRFERSREQMEGFGKELQTIRELVEAERTATGAEKTAPNEALAEEVSRLQAAVTALQAMGEASEAPNVAPRRQRRSSGKGLLVRAMTADPQGSGSSPAVKRIIGNESDKPLFAPAPIPAGSKAAPEAPPDTSEAEVESTEVKTQSSAVDLSSEVDAEAEERGEAKVEPSVENAVVADDDAEGTSHTNEMPIVTEAEAKPAPGAKAKPSQVSSGSASAYASSDDEGGVATAVAEPESARPAAAPLLFDDLPKASAKAPKASAKDTVVEAQVLIGIGNKPYVRGDLPGLSWELGRVMDFCEVGRWQWIAPEGLPAGGGKVQVWRNDAEPDTGGVRTIRAGERLVIEPRF